MWQKRWIVVGVAVNVLPLILASCAESTSTATVTNEATSTATVTNETTPTVTVTNEATPTQLPPTPTPTPTLLPTAHYTAQLDFITQWGSQGRGDGQFSQPMG